MLVLPPRLLGEGRRRRREEDDVIMSAPNIKSGGVVAGSAAGAAPGAAAASAAAAAAAAASAAATAAPAANSTSPSMIPTAAPEQDGSDYNGSQVIFMDPLPPRFWALVINHTRLLLCFLLMILLGLVLHAGKISSITPSLNIDGYEAIVAVALQEKNQLNSRVSYVLAQLSHYTPNRLPRLSIGNLLAAELLLTAIQIAPSSAFLGLLQPPSMEIMAPILPPDNKLLDPVDVTTMYSCSIHEHALGRVLCPQLESPPFQDLSSDQDERMYLLGCRDTGSPTPELAQVGARAIAYLPKGISAWGPLLLDAAFWGESPGGGNNALTQLHAHAHSLASNNNPPDELLRRHVWRESLVAAVHRLAISHPKLRGLRKVLGDTIEKDNNSNNSIIPLESIKAVERHLSSVLGSKKSRLISIGTRAPMGLSDLRVWLVGAEELSQSHITDFSYEKHFQSSGITSPPAFDLLQRAVQVIEQGGTRWEIHKASVVPSRFLAVPRLISNTSLNEPTGKRVLDLFNKTGGIISPVYVGESLIRRWVGAGRVYVVLFLAWLPCLLSPQPVTLVHFPRLLLYGFLFIYRAVVLYWASGRLERLLFARFDFSDHVVFLLTACFVACTERVAAERYHTRIPVQVSVIDQRDHVIVDGEYVKVHDSLGASPPGSRREASGWRKRLYDWCCCPDEQTSLPTTTNNNVILKADKWKWPQAVWITRVLCWAVEVVSLYSALFTAVFFHNRRETILGFCYAVIALWVPAWVLVRGGWLSLDRVGILKS